MATIKDVLYAVDETLKLYPENNMTSAMSHVFEEKESNYTYFTSTNGARETIKRIPKNEIVAIIAKELVSIYNYCTIIINADPTIANVHNLNERYHQIDIKCPYYEQVKRIINTIKGNNINSVLYLLNNNATLLEATYIVEEYYYHHGSNMRDLLARYGDGRQLPSRCEATLKEKIDNDYRKITGVRNIQVNNHAVNKCFTDIVNGNQIRNMNNNYSVAGGLYATMHVGKKRINQEDSVLIMNHPSNPDFKILVVSDGMGGGISGEEVSNFTVKEIGAWFQTINPEYYTRPDIVQTLFNRKIEEISSIINQRYNKGSDKHIQAGATFTVAIVTQNETVITQIGDSRAYAVKGGFFGSKLKLITRDESFVWPRDNNNHAINPKNLSPRELEDIRYRRGSNSILRCIGQKLNAYDQSFIIPNNSYDKLLLMSDGASDLLDFEGIKIICKKTPWKDITRLLVEAAITKKQFVEKIGKNSIKN